MDPGRAGFEIDELPDIYPSSWQFWDWSMEINPDKGGS